MPTNKTTKKKKRKSRTSQPLSIKVIAGSLVKKAETNEGLKGELLEQTAEIVKESAEFQDELVRAVLTSKKLKQEALERIFDEVLD